MSSNLTLQQVANFCATHADLLPVTGVGGFLGEPFLSLANDAISDLLSDANDWKFNRVEMPLMVTCPKKQDYLFAGATVFSLGSTAQGWAIDLSTNSAITVSAGVVTVKTIETHRFSLGDTIYLHGVTMSVGTTASYNSTFTDNGTNTAWSNGWVITAVSSTALTFAATTGQNNSDIGGAPGITNFGFLTASSMVMMTNTSSPQASRLLTPYRELPVSSLCGEPTQAAVISDNGTGTLRIRFYLTPSTVSWGAKFTYQASAPVKTAMTANWSPFPDMLSSLIRQAMIYRLYRYINSPTADVEYQKLQVAIRKAQSGDDAEETSISLQPESGLMESTWWNW